MILHSVANCVALVLALTCSSATTPSDATDDDPPTPSKASITVTGVLTTEGVECQAMRGDDGQLYTLGGDLKDYRAGDRVKVTGRVADVSICMQGTTISVATIERAPE